MQRKKEVEMLELYPCEIIGDDPDANKQRKKALKTIKQQQYQMNAFQMLSNRVGKGNKKSSKKTQMQND